MLTWLLAPTLVTLSLTATGPASVTGQAHGLAAEPCVVHGSYAGTRVGLTVICVDEFIWGRFTAPRHYILDVNPETLGGTWIGPAGEGTLQPYH
jgi:hypothetical protein